MPAVVNQDTANQLPEHIRFESTGPATPNEKPADASISPPDPQDSSLGELPHPPPPDQRRRARVAVAIVRRTVGWVVAGVAVMLLGIGISHAVILDKIHSCPPNGVCSTFFDPNKSNILNLLQILMDYWLKFGLILACFGLIKLSAYQAWFSTMKNGNTIDNLDLTLGAIKGGLLDAFRLALNRATFLLSSLVLAQIGLGSLVSLLVGLSIVRTQGTREIYFTYPDVSELPNSSISNLNNDGQTRAIGKVVNWALTNDTTHSGAFKGTLVVPDGRSNASINAVPGGPVIDGAISCTGIPAENVTHVDNDGAPAYNITVGTRVYLSTPDLVLATTQLLGIDTAFVPYLWVSNTTDFLPNATSIDDGAFWVAKCNHTVFMRNSTVEHDPSAQVINPNIISSVPGCTSTDRNTCVADSVSNAILQWWGGLGQSFWRVTCRGGVLGPVKTVQFCGLTPEIWSATTVGMLDGIMQTAPSQSTSNQTLIATVQVINTRRWWLIQSIIPILTCLLYIVTLAYTVYISEGNTVLKELNLAEIIDAAQTDHVRDLVKTGRLRKSVVRYGSNVGFLEDNSRRRD